MIRRLRPLPDAAALATMYAEPHDHMRWGGVGGHRERVEATIALAKATLGPWDRSVIADLSCGNGAIAEALAHDDTVLHLGDMAGMPGMREVLADVGYHGPIEQTLLDLPHVDLFICSETIEHLDNPPTVLAGIRERADRLLLSTPIGCWDDDNPEHLFAWDRDGVESMLVVAGWRVVAYDQVDGTAFGGPYVFGIWVCR